MKKDEYITTLVINGKCIPVGLNDAGQSYFIEYVDGAGNLVEECCGSYNTDFIGYVEYKFGKPEVDCEYYKTMELRPIDEDCPNNLKYGYCDKCKFQKREWSHFQKLIELGIIDRRGNVMQPYQSYLVKRDIIEEAANND